ncbi:hypothetical protein QBC36DRAFT_318075 [Triangularia setosa]|uniref:Secreted protein n=1 Tax=Triangularia setosa TaxID=2587417 RepID=A0AAN6WJC7_9PEZI|nr:hypothetical protein QBC36DRAFT_318075 [Podospora setosa]
MSWDIFLFSPTLLIDPLYCAVMFLCKNPLIPRTEPKQKRQVCYPYCCCPNTLSVLDPANQSASRDEKVSQS